MADYLLVLSFLALSCLELFQGEVAGYLACLFLPYLVLPGLVLSYQL